MDINSTLAWLFERYQENPDTRWNISECFDSNNTSGYDIQALGKHLVQKGFVKNYTLLEDGGFTCTITTLGIVQVSNILNEVQYKILEATIEGNKKSVMEILEVDQEHYTRAQDYTNYLKRTGIIECIFHKNDVLASPTFYGREWYSANKRAFAN